MVLTFVLLNKLSDLSNVDNFIAAYGLRIFYTILTLVLGSFLVRILSSISSKIIDELFSKKDITLANFLKSLFSLGLKVLLFITAGSVLGLETTSFAAIIGAVALSIGLAMQGSLTNFAGGVLTVILRPYKVGDSIEYNSLAGTVQEIGMFHTKLTTGDNKIIIIPNNSLFTNTVINLSTGEKRRLEITFTLEKLSDVQAAQEVMQTVASSLPQTLKEDKIDILFLSVSDLGAVVTLRFWVKFSDFSKAQSDCTSQIVHLFREKSINIAFRRS